MVGLRAADPRRGSGRYRSWSGRRPPGIQAGWVGRGGRCCSRSPRPAAAALPGRLQKAPESNSNFCQTHEPTWQRVTWRPLKPSSRPLGSRVPARAGRLKGTCGLLPAVRPRGGSVLCQSLQGSARHRGHPTHNRGGTGPARWQSPAPKFIFPKFPGFAELLSTFPLPQHVEPKAFSSKAFYQY